MGGATPETDMTYQGIVDGKERWEAVGTPEIGDEVRWDRLGNVETVALLSKLDIDKHIDIQIELDEIDLTSAESKATYAQIK